MKARGCYEALRSPRSLSRQGFLTQNVTFRLPQRYEADSARFRPVWFRTAGGSVDTPVFDREEIGRGQEIDGPAIVEEWTSTTLLPPGWRAILDRLGNLVLTRGEAP